MSLQDKAQIITDSLEQRLSRFLSHAAALKRYSAWNYKFYLIVVPRAVIKGNCEIIKEGIKLL